MLHDGLYTRHQQMSTHTRKIQCDLIFVAIPQYLIPEARPHDWKLHLNHYLSTTHDPKGSGLVIPTLSNFRTVT